LCSKQIQELSESKTRKKVETLVLYLISPSCPKVAAIVGIWIVFKMTFTASDGIPIRVKSIAMSGLSSEFKYESTFTQTEKQSQKSEP
jgi:hypothetical protein